MIPVMDPLFKRIWRDMFALFVSGETSRGGQVKDRWSERKEVFDVFSTCGWWWWAMACIGCHGKGGHL